MNGFGGGGEGSGGGQRGCYWQRGKQWKRGDWQLVMKEEAFEKKEKN